MSMTIWQLLEEPFEWVDVEIKVQSLNSDKTKAMPVVYFDARCVRRRLNEVLGHDAWWPEYRELWSPDGKLFGIVCKINVRVGDQIVSREDVGVPTAIEPIKGAYSDAIKRAFAGFGNDHLYDIELGWHPYSGNKYKPFEQNVIARLKAMYDSQIDARRVREPRFIASDAQEEPEPQNKAINRGVATVKEKVAHHPNGELDLGGSQ